MANRLVVKVPNILQTVQIVVFQDGLPIGCLTSEEVRIDIIRPYIIYIIRRKFVNKGGGYLGIGIGEGLLNLFRRINQQTIVRHLIQLIVTSGQREGSNS